MKKEKLIGFTKEIIEKISASKDEPKWMLDLRMEALDKFKQTNHPEWGVEIEDLNFEKIIPYVTGQEKVSTDWEDVPQDIKEAYDKLGIPEAEKKVLAGSGAQYQTNMIYNKIKKYWQKKGVIFLNSNDALKNHEDLFKKYFSKAIKLSNNRYSLLHYAFWSGGTFIYVPKGVKIKAPLQGYFYMEGGDMGQFEHTVIIADEGSEVHYIEGCSAPQFSKLNIHAGVVEVFVEKNARVRFSTVQNWSKNIFNMGMKSAIVKENGIIEWVSGSFGSKKTMLYPSSILLGNNSKSTALSISVASKDQHLDTGFKSIHLGKNTSSSIQAKSIVLDGGFSSYRGFVDIHKNAENSKASVECDSLMMDNISKSDSLPTMKINNDSSYGLHEAKIGKISDKEIFYLTSKGIDEKTAKEMIVNGFIEPIVKDLPLEYAVELNRLISMEIESNIG